MKVLTVLLVVTAVFSFSASNAQCPAPTVSSPTPLPACVGSSVAIIASSATSGASHRFYTTEFGGTPLSGVSTNPGNPTVSTYTTHLGSSQIFYVSTYRAGQCESGRVPITITIKGFSPSLQPSGNPTAACPNEFFLTASGGTSYQWRFAGSNIDGATGAIHYPTQSGSYSVLINNGCQNVTLSINVTLIDPVPGFSLTTSVDPNNFCLGNSSHLLIASGATSYQWLRNGSPITGATASTYHPTQSGTYSVNVTGSGCTAAVQRGSVSVTVIPNPILSPSTNPSCFLASNSGHTLYVTGGTAYQWKLNGSVISGATGSSYHPTVSGNYSVDVTISCGIVSLGTIPITVIPLPTITPSGDPNTICSGAANSYWLTASSGNGYQWKRNGSTISGATSSAYKPTEPGSYTVIVGTSTCGNQESAAISVSGAPPAAPLGSTAFVCVNGSTMLSADSELGVTHRWYDESNTIVSHQVLSTTNRYVTGIMHHNATSDRTYSVATVNACGESARTTVSLKITPTPSAPIITGNKRIGSGTVALAVNPVQSGHSYAWYDAHNNWLANGTGYAPLQVFEGSATNAFYAIATNATCASEKSWVNITICSKGSIASDPDPGCVNAANTAFLLRINDATPGSSYQWRANGTPIDGATGSSYHPVVSGTYSALVTTECGAEESASIPVTIFTMPQGDLEVKGDVLKFCAGNVHDKLIAPAGYLYQWKRDGGNIAGATQRAYHPMVTGSYSVEIGNESGCVYKTLGPIQVTVIDDATCPANTIAFGQGNHAVNPATGMLTVNIPIFNVVEGDLQVPGVLMYTGTGVKVTDDSGWVGQNWSLSVQGYGVTRELRGLPDDYTATSPDERRGWLNNSQAANIINFTPSTDNNPVTCADEAANYDFLNGIDFRQDTEPDVFSVVAPGLSFQFYFDENKQAQVVPYQDVVVTPNTVTGPITSFTVKDSRGVEYWFEGLETMTQSVRGPNSYYQVRRSNMFLQSITYHTGWKLTKMVSPVYGTIDFTYTTLHSNKGALAPNGSKLTYRYPVTFANATGANSQITYDRFYVFKIPERITSPSMEVEFISGDTVNSATGRLVSVKVYDKREGGLKLARTIGFSYASFSNRTFPMVLIDQGAQHGVPPRFHFFEYYGATLPTEAPSLPGYQVPSKDEWGFYKMEPGAAGYSLYEETVVRASLKQVTYPEKGYSVFFYEPHDYWNGTATVQGGGLRVRKIVSYDGVSAAAGIKEYEYKAENGQSSGKLQHLPARALSVVRVDRYGTTMGARYRDVSLANPGIPQVQLDSYFTVKTRDELSNSDLLSGSSVAYGRIKEATRGGGYSIYEYELPASYGETSANDGEWQASKVSVARPSTGTGFCFEKGPVPDGYNVYPFPPHPDYDFAQVLLKKQTDFRDDGVKRREVTFDYQRLYGGTAIRKIYGLAIEELPTYYHNGTAYVDGKMFLYSKYPVFTDVKTVLKKRTEIVYPTTDITRKNETVTEYFFESAYHRDVSRTVKVNSDDGKLVTRFRYVNDYPVASAGDPETTAIQNLRNAHRTSTLVETINSRIDGTTEKFVSAAFQTFQVISGKAYPYQQFTFLSDDGETAFNPSSTSTNGSITTFSFEDEKYKVNETILSVDNYGAPKEVIGRNRRIQTSIAGFSGTLSVIGISNATATEIRYSDFETGTERVFTAAWNPTPAQGRHGSRGIVLPASTGAPNALTGGIATGNTDRYTFSCWLNPTTTGSLTITFSGATTVNAQLPFNASGGVWKYYTVDIPIPPLLSNSGFSAEVRSDAAVPIDDVALYPAHAAIRTTAYAIPFGPSIETDGRGNCIYMSYDEVGRLKLVLDRDGNIIKKYDYQIKP